MEQNSSFDFSIHSFSFFVNTFIWIHFGFRYDATPEADEEDEEKKGLLELDSD